MIVKRDWQHVDGEHYYYYSVDDGRICGQVHKIVHTKVWVAKIVNNHNDDTYLGQYISSIFAMKSIQCYWDIQERTLIE